jgi:uncharacterized protein (DUF1800 family)
VAHVDQRKLSEEQKKTSRDERNQQAMALKAWWLAEMHDSPDGLNEKMTLFWHNHFVSGLDKVGEPVLMYRQNALLRREALGNFGQMLHDIAHDPAMMRYLDTVNNRKGAANENFAREVMELFTLGEGHYTEQDIREAARAFTGWSLDANLQFVFRPQQHDNGIKTVLGQSGNLDGDAVLSLLLQNPQTARFVTAKLWRAFVSPNPDPDTVNRLADLFYRRHYAIRPLMRALLLTPSFWQSAGQQTKSPIELTVGSLVTFDLAPADWRSLVNLNRQLGQDVFDPPNVKGWPGGEAWINSATLLGRKQFLARIGQDAGRGALGNGGGMVAINGTPNWLSGSAQACAPLLLALPPAMPLPADRRCAQALAGMLLDPVYQVQ